MIHGWADVASIWFAVSTCLTVLAAMAWIMHGGRLALALLVAAQIVNLAALCMGQYGLMSVGPTCAWLTWIGLAWHQTARGDRP
jgi:hypothetical protein